MQYNLLYAVRSADLSHFAILVHNSDVSCDMHCAADLTAHLPVASFAPAPASSALPRLSLLLAVIPSCSLWRRLRCHPQRSPSTWQSRNATSASWQRQSTHRCQQTTTTSSLIERQQQQRRWQLQQLHLQHVSWLVSGFGTTSSRSSAAGCEWVGRQSQWQQQLQLS